jgi:5'-3' exonuclease
MLKLIDWMFFKAWCCCILALTEKILCMCHSQMCRCRILREYLDAEMRVEGLPFEFDLERAIDDFVLLCILVGNDFLPHSPVLDISEGAMDTLFDMYNSALPALGGFITYGEKIVHRRLELFMQMIAAGEMDMLVERAKVCHHSLSLLQPNCTCALPAVMCCC